MWQLVSRLAVCLQLALTHSPPLSEIFVFTDASPKDAHLFDAVKALALEKQSKVGFNLKDNSSPLEATLSSADGKTMVMMSSKTLSHDFTGKWRHFLVLCWKNTSK